MLIILASLVVSFIHAKRVAVIGCGVGGTYLASLLKSSHEVVVFEKSVNCGGRTDIHVLDQLASPVELGASFLIKDNQYLMETITKHDLSISERDSGIIAIVANKTVLFESSSNSAWTVLKMAYRYGLTPKHVSAKAAEQLERFQEIYKFQESNQVFTDYDQFLSIIGLQGIEQSFEAYLKSQSYDQLFLDEFVDAIILSIYNQKYKEINTIAGIVSLIAAFNPAYTVDGGNRKIVEALSAGLEVRHIEVASIAKRPDGGYLLNDNDEYDVVVIAHLITDSRIKFSNTKFENAGRTSKNQDTHIYLVGGKLRLEYFGLEAENANTYLILDQEVSGLRRLCANCTCNCKSAQNIYKIQARKALDLSKLFYQYELFKYQFWNPAYPKLEANQRFEIELDENLYYLNSMEYVASCMEMEMISARNIANLIEKRQAHPPGRNREDL